MISAHVKSRTNQRRAGSVSGGLSAVAMVLLAGGAVVVPYVPCASAQAQQPQAEAAPTAKAAAKPAKAPVKRAGKPADAQQAAAKPSMTREEAVRLVEAGQAAQAAGKNDDAVKHFTQAIGGGALDPPQVARALYKRGALYNAQGKSSAAIGDLSQAIYLGGLPEADRADARQQRGMAYQNAGMTDLAEADFKAAKAGGDPARRQVASGTSSTAPPAKPSGGFFGGLFGGNSGPPSAPAAQPAPKPPVQAAAAPPAPSPSPIQTASVPAAAASPAAAPPSNSGDGVGSFFGGLFGGGSSAQSPSGQSTGQSTGSAVPPPSTSGSAAIVSGAQPTAVSASEPTRVPGAERPAKTAVAAAPAPAVRPATAARPASPATGGNVRVQVANLNSEQEANALVEKLRTSQRDLLAGREPSVARVVYGNMGTFYQVHIGPFASVQAGEQACPRLRGGGLDCLVLR